MPRCGFVTCSTSDPPSSLSVLCHGPLSVSAIPILSVVRWPLECEDCVDPHTVSAYALQTCQRKQSGMFSTMVCE